MTWEAPSTFCFWTVALLLESVLRWQRSSPETPAGTLNHMQPLASKLSQSFRGRPDLQVCCGVAMDCWASTPPFLIPSIQSWLWLNLGVLLL